MNLLSLIGRGFRTSGRDLFVLSNRRAELGVGSVALGILGGFMLGVLVANPQTSLSDISSTLAGAGKLMMTYGAFVGVCIGFWLIALVVRPFNHAKQSGRLASKVWQLYGVVLVLGMLTPVWLWAAFATSSPLALKVRELAGTWFNMAGFTGYQLVVTLIMSATIFSALFYAMVQLGGTAYANDTRRFSPDDHSSQPLVLVTFGRFAGTQLWAAGKIAGTAVRNVYTNWRIKAQAAAVMKNAEVKATAQNESFMPASERQFDTLSSSGFFDEFLDTTGSDPQPITVSGEVVRL